MKLYTSKDYPLHMIAELPDNHFCTFYISPIRKVTETEFIPVEKPEDLKEADSYYYWMYGLKKG